MEDIYRFLGLNSWVQSIADVGCGRGNYGWLIREHEKRPHDRDTWKRRLVGYEGFDGYVKSPQNQFYDEIIYDDIRNVNIEGFDLVLLVEVIEHLTKDDGIKLLQKLASCNKEILLTTPDGFKESKSIYNILGEHKCGYSLEEIKKLGFKAYKRKGCIVGYSKGLRYFKDSFWVRMGVKIIPRSLKNKF